MYTFAPSFYRGYFIELDHLLEVKSVNVFSHSTLVSGQAQ